MAPIPNVLRVLDGGTDPLPHVVMELVPGTDFAAELACRGALSPLKNRRVGRAAEAGFRSHR